MMMMMMMTMMMMMMMMIDIVLKQEIVVSASDERRVVCLITNKSCESKPFQTINLPVSTPCKQLFTEIRKHFDLLETKIQLVSIAYDYTIKVSIPTLLHAST